MATPAALHLVHVLKNSASFQEQLALLGDGPMQSVDPQQAFDLKWIISKLPTLLPLILSIFTGGFSVSLIPVIIQIVAELFGITPDEARELVKA